MKYLIKHQNDIDEILYNVLANTRDFISGFCSLDNCLYPDDKF
jgi:hypothetical protein